MIVVPTFYKKDLQMLGLRALNPETTGDRSPPSFHSHYAAFLPFLAGTAASSFGRPR